MNPTPAGDVIASTRFEPDFLRLQINTVGGWYLAIENDFIVEEGGMGRYDSRTQSDNAVAALQAHVGDMVARFDVSENGSLRLAVGTVTLEVEPADDFEAWHATGPPPDKHMIICLPGGNRAR
jgi:uncharacterized protein DUF6188